MLIVAGEGGFQIKGGPIAKSAQSEESYVKMGRMLKDKFACTPPKPKEKKQTINK